MTTASEHSLILPATADLVWGTVSFVTIVEDAKKNASVEAKRVADAAQRQIEADAKLARTQLRRDVGSLAAELAGRIVGEQALDPKVSSAVVDSFLDELEADVSAPAGQRPKEK